MEASPASPGGPRGRGVVSLPQAAAPARCWSMMYFRRRTARWTCWPCWVNLGARRSRRHALPPLQLACALSNGRRPCRVPAGYETGQNPLKKALPPALARVAFSQSSGVVPSLRRNTRFLCILDQPVRPVDVPIPHPPFPRSFAPFRRRFRALDLTL